MGFIDLSRVLFGAHASTFASDEEDDTAPDALHAHSHHNHHEDETDETNDLVEGDTLIPANDLNNDGFISSWEQPHA